MQVGPCARMFCAQYMRAFCAFHEPFLCAQNVMRTDRILSKYAQLCSFSH